jgi:hypothetical protein
MIRRLFCKTVLVLCGVGTRHDDVVVIFVAMDACRDGVVWVFEDSFPFFFLGYSLYSHFVSFFLLKCLKVRK